MVAPSPDWFVGVAGLDLLEAGDWAAERVIDLYPWDAGTDSGATYTSSDQPTVPPTAISAITGAPFTPGVPLGTLTFTRIDLVSAVPPAVELALQAWPNPFNPRTTVAWDLPITGPVEVAVYDPRGRRVASLLDAVQPAGLGAVIWNGRGDDGRIMPAGTYVVRVDSPAGQARIKLTLLK